MFTKKNVLRKMVVTAVIIATLAAQVSVVASASDSSPNVISGSDKTTSTSKNTEVPSGVTPVATYNIEKDKQYKIPEKLRKDGNVYSSNNPASLDVNQTAVFKAAKDGTFFIIIENNGKTSYIKLNVGTTATSTTKSPSSTSTSTTTPTKSTGTQYIDSSDKGKDIILILERKVGKEEQLYAIRKPGDTFSSSDTSILTVTSGGKFKVIKEGTAYIVVKNGAKTTYIKVMTKPYQIFLDEKTFQTDFSKKPHLKSDGSIDHSYYVYEITKTTLDKYQPPQEIRYNPKNPIEGQLVRDTNGNLLMYYGSYFVEIISSEEEQRRERLNISYATAGTRYAYTGDAYLSNTNLGALYTGGTPKSGQYKLVNGQLMYYASSMWGWSTVGMVSSIAHNISENWS